jgi:hypothetical protein
VAKIISRRDRWSSAPLLEKAEIVSDRPVLDNFSVRDPHPVYGPLRESLAGRLDAPERSLVCH